jgi:exodeoxyribonuclease VII small subunit
MATFAPAWSDTVPKPSVTPPATPPLADELARLEEIVRRLEADDVELDAALALFEEGVARLRAARERLADAGLKVQAVLEAADGDIRLTDLDG